MKMRTMATVAAAVMGLSLLSAPAFAHDGHRGGHGYGYHQSDGRGHDCNDRKHYSHRGDYRRFADRRGHHDGWRDQGRRHDDDGYRDRDRHRDRHDGRRGR